MAKKKSAKQDQAQQNIEKPESSDNQTPENDISPNRQDKTELKQTNPENTITPTNPENTIPPDEDTSLHATGEVSLDELVFSDPQVLSRLRSAILSPSEVYREAQTFEAQQLNVASLLQSGESILIQNTIEILRTINVWFPESVICLLDADERARELTSRYILQCLKRNLLSPLDIVCDLENLLRNQNKEEWLLPFADKLCAAFITMIEQADTDAQNALTKLCNHLSKTTVGRLLYDPAPAIRIAVIRNLTTRPSVDINDLSVSLVLLKDRDEQVNIAIMRMLAHFATCPELVVPQLLPLLAGASAELRDEILNVFKCYNNDAVEPVIQSLESTQEDIYDAIRLVIAQSAQRYTDALIRIALSPRTHEHVRTRAIEILHTHMDPNRRDEIEKVLKTLLPSPIDPNIEWIPPDTTQKFLPKATQQNDVYEKLLDESEIADLSKNCPEEVLSRLLCDASETVQINALHVIRYRKEATPALKAIINVWMKSASPALASAALDAYLTIENDLDAAVEKIIDAFAHGESAEVKKHFFNVLAEHQSSIDALIRAYYQTPRKCSGFIMKFLMTNPSKATLKSILAGLNRNQSVACIVETMLCLLKVSLNFDNKKIRPDLLAHLREPVSFGQHGFEARLLSIKLLRKYLTEPGEPRDDATIASLQAFYKEAKNAELKKNTKDLLKDLGEEIFDFDDEEDDFEDLNDEEDDL
ncbi:MAG: hypothetical protein IJM59_01810 [Proteobacteria bacterium]|nr:hypothetical protein [Pseudomonadota bacterium]